ncbi:Centrosomal protein [Nymphon striatum]|nr:Centrosomal protein [Nymphon striatum]
MTNLGRRLIRTPSAFGKANLDDLCFLVVICLNQLLNNSFSGVLNNFISVLTLAMDHFKSMDENFNRFSLLAPGVKDTVDDSTIHGTPLPQITSTGAHKLQHHKRPNMDDFSLVRNFKDSFNCGEEYNHAADRSSLGLLDLDSISGETAIPVSSSQIFLAKTDKKNNIENLTTNIPELNNPSPNSNTLNYQPKPNKHNSPEKQKSEILSHSSSRFNTKLFHLDEEYLKKLENLSSVHDDEFLMHDNNEVDFELEQISARSTSVGSDDFSNYFGFNQQLHNSGDLIAAQSFLSCFEKEPKTTANDKENLISDEALKMLAKDEEKFKTENEFKISKNTLCTYDNQADNSWAVTSNIQDVTRPSWLSSPLDDQSYIRLSIGQFMRSKTEALGSLGDKNNEPRPNFGTEIHSPQHRFVGNKEISQLPVIKEISSANNSVIDVKNSDSETMERLRKNVVTDTDSSETTISNSDRTVISMSTISKLLNDASLTTDPKALADMIMNYKNPKIKSDPVLTNRNGLPFSKPVTESVAKLNETCSISVPASKEKAVFKVPISPVPRINAINTLSRNHYFENCYGSKNDSDIRNEYSDLKQKGGTVFPEEKWKEPRLSSMYFRKNELQMSLIGAECLEDNLNESAKQNVYTNSTVNMFPNSSCKPDRKSHQKERNSLLSEENHSHVRKLNFDDTSLSKSSQEYINSKMDSSLASTLKLEVPEYFNFSETQCVGIASCQYLPLKNSSPVWIQCTIEIIALKSNGKNLYPKNYLNLFVFSDKVSIEPFKTQNLKMIFAPTIEASFEASLQILASPLSVNEVNKNIPIFVTITAVAESPKIKLMCDKNDQLDFGTIPEGCSIVKSINIINLGKATVPLRIHIQNGTSMQNFKFCDIDTSTPIEKVMSNILSCKLPGGSTNSLKVDIQCQALCLLQDEKKQINPLMALLNVEIDVPNLSKAIADSVSLIANVGSVKLHIKCPEEPLVIKGIAGKESNQDVQLMNSGNVPLYLKVLVTNDENFSVIPSEVALYPFQHGSVTLTFRAESVCATMKSLLMFAVQPNGYIYEVEVVGHCLSSKVVVPSASKPADESCTLETNRSLVSWGGIAVNSSLKQEILLRNGSHENLLYLKAFFKGSDFQFLTHDEKLENTQEFILSPRQELPVFVNYSPKIVSEANAKLVFRPRATSMKNIKFSVKLFAYSGLSKLEVEGIHVNNSQEETFHYLNIEEMTGGSSTVFPITVSNVGDRSMFVKILAFSDVHYENIMPVQHYTVQPNEFVLPENESKKLIIAMKQLSKKDNCGSFVGSLYFISGDEISRQKYKGAMKTTSKSKIKLPQLDPKDPVFSVNFDVPYQNESPYSQDISSCPDDIPIFFSSLSRLPVRLHCNSSSSFQDASFSVLKADETLFSVYNDTLKNDEVLQEIPSVCHNSPPVRGRKTENFDHHYSSAARNVRTKTWDVFPSEIILSEDLNEGTSKVHIINYTNQNQKFDFSWPGNILAIKPSNGIILPRASSTIVATLNSSQDIDKRSVYVLITCNGEEKRIKVEIDCKIMKEFGRLNSHSGQTSRRSIPVHVNQELVFKDTLVGCICDDKLEIFNSSYQSSYWFLSPTASPTSQNNDETNQVSYDVFNVSKLSGEMGARQHLFLEVRFQPRQNGIFSQIWQLQLATKNKESHSIKLKLMGKCVDKPIVEQPVEKLVKPKNKSLPEGPLYISYNTVKFPVTKVNSSSCVKVTIKNTSNKLYKLQVIRPTSPFSISHPTISVKGKCYTSLPVFFKPTECKSYDVPLTIKSDLPYNLSVSLHGTAI